MQVRGGKSQSETLGGQNGAVGHKLCSGDTWCNCGEVLHRAMGTTGVVSPVQFCAGDLGEVDCGL